MNHTILLIAIDGASMVQLIAHLDLPHYIHSHRGGQRLTFYHAGLGVYYER